MYHVKFKVHSRKSQVVHSNHLYQRRQEGSPPPPPPDGYGEWILNSLQQIMSRLKVLEGRQRQKKKQKRKLKPKLPEQCENIGSIQTVSELC